MKALHRWLLLAALLTLAGCGSLPPAPVTDASRASWAERQQQLTQLDHWEIHARAAIFVEDDVYQVGITWRRAQDSYLILIEAPFGQGVFRLESLNADNLDATIKLTLPDEQPFYGASAELLLNDLLGWSLPVSGLKSWIKGLPGAQQDYSFDLNADGTLKSLRQDGWLINYLKYFDADSDNHGLPQRMYLKHQDAALKIVIERWKPLAIEVDSSDLFPNFD